MKRLSMKYVSLMNKSEKKAIFIEKIVILPVRIVVKENDVLTLLKLIKTLVNTIRQK